MDDSIVPSTSRVSALDEISANDSNLESITFCNQDPLGLNVLHEAPVPTYSYTIDEGLQSNIAPVTANSAPFIIASQSFSLAPLVRLDPETTEATVPSKSFALVKNSEPGVRLKKYTVTPTPLDKMRYIQDKYIVSLECEWEGCATVFEDLNEFLGHVADHVTDVPIISTKIAAVNTEEGVQDLVDDYESQKTFGCLWQDCGFETVDSGEIIRHLNFHSFHTNIKALGNKTLEETGIVPCSLSSNQKNVLPQLPECDFLCGWDNCDRIGEVFAEPIKFYWHVQRHAEENRPSRFAFGKGAKKKQDILCQWSNCTFKAGTAFKLKDHLKSHSAERVVACPNCGSLFASRSKFQDHCTRQLKVDEGLVCSYCQKAYPSERLLRDHMRSHINHLQCPLCNMTCTSATALNKHVTYRHSEVREYSCPIGQDDEDEAVVRCDYTAKTQNDLNKHIRNVHYGDKTYKCDRDGCPKTFKCKTTLKFHVEKVHENVGPKYCCHLCPRRFRRGNYLTTHLAAVHDYKWPPGHKKFTYTMDESGLYHVQTMRFESFDIFPEQIETVTDE